MFNSMRKYLNGTNGYYGLIKLEKKVTSVSKKRRMDNINVNINFMPIRGLVVPS